MDAPFSESAGDSSENCRPKKWSAFWFRVAALDLSSTTARVDQQGRLLERTTSSFARAEVLAKASLLRNSVSIVRRLVVRRFF